MHAYRAASVEGSRPLRARWRLHERGQGVAALVQGGGFGSFFEGLRHRRRQLHRGGGAHRRRQAAQVVNHAQDPVLFWALKGGGGGTFGAITWLTLATHPLPESFCAIDLTIHAKS